jgi:hypothetical protein
MIKNFNLLNAIVRFEVNGMTRVPVTSFAHFVPNYLLDLKNKNLFDKE